MRVKRGRRPRVRASRARAGRDAPPEGKDRRAHAHRRRATVEREDKALLPQLDRPVLPRAPRLRVRSQRFPGQLRAPRRPSELGLRAQTCGSSLRAAGTAASRGGGGATQRHDAGD